VVAGIHGEAGLRTGAGKRILFFCLKNYIDPGSKAVGTKTAGTLVPERQYQLGNRD
jgi:hypothetical protein